MSTARFNRVSKIDFRFLFITLFAGAIAAWHYMDGNIVPDAIFFTVLALFTLWMSFIGIGAEGDIEWEE